MSVEIPSSGGAEGVFGIGLVFEALVMQEAVEMLEKVVGDGREVRRLWRVRQIS